MQAIKGHVPRVVSSLKPVGEVEGSRRIDLAIGLPLRNREALTNLLQRIYDPRSSDFHRFLTPAQFAERFGPTAQEYQAVMEFARSNHLVITGTHPNLLLVDVNAAAADIERALHLKLRVYRHPSERRTFYSPDVEPAVDPRVPILSVAGLDDFFLPRPSDLRLITRAQSSGGSQRAANGIQANAALDATGSGPAGTFIGQDFRAAYAPGMSLDGAGESIGLFELASYFPGDIATYEDLAGLPQVPVTNVLVNGFNKLPDSNNGEVALDIEMAMSMSPGVDRIIVYEGAKPNDVLNRMATDNLARQLSCSWTFGQQVDATGEQIFQQMAAQGQSFFQASADAGAYAAGAPAPSDDPLVTSVGGTSLVTTGPHGAWKSEAAWSGSGGGVSARYAIPVWQQSVGVGTNQGSSTMRNVPDVAAVADAVIWSVANNGEQGTASGTSAAAPLWAGFTALVNQQASLNHQPGVGFLNPALYSIGQGPAYPAAFHDIIAGNNTNAVSPNRFFAVSGYDLCTGWGTPKGSNLVAALLAPPDSLRISPDSDLLLTGPVGGPFTASSVTLTNAGLTGLSWSIGGEPAWLSVSPSSGTLSPAGAAASVSVTLGPGAASLAAGSYAVDLWFTNNNDGFIQNRRIVLDIVTSPLITGQPASLSLPFGATARFAVTTATNALLFYQWIRNGTPLQESARVNGSAAPTLTLSALNASDAGSYSVIVSNAAGVSVSVKAALVLTSSPPVIAAQPVSQTVLPGLVASFSITAFGDAPLSYQWRSNGVDLIDAGNKRGSATSSLSVAPVTTADAATYSVVVSNSFGVRTSAEASLQVVPLTSPEIAQSITYSFEGTNGAHPNGLTRGWDGNIYGATQTGGSDDSGTLFVLSTADTPRLLYSFSGLADGARPNGELIQAADRGLLGTAYGGGSNAFGTLFQLGSNNTLTTLFTLDHTNGVLPTAGLIQGKDGALYGTAYEGGVFHYGTVFRLDTNGAFSVAFAFANTNGAFPHASLMRAADGSLYGTTYKGGLFGYGTVFRISPAGVFSTVVNFDGNNGSFPTAGLMQSTDGALYGTTTYGGSFNLGTVFRLSLNGILSNLVSFAGAANGSHPRSRLMQSSDGNLYGTTSDGGSFGAGTVFRMTPEGILGTVAEFDGFNGSDPEAALAEDNDGSLLGVARNGGAAGQGVLFRLQTVSAPHITSQPASLTTYESSTVALSVASFGSAPLFYKWQKDGTNLIDAGNILGAGTRILLLTNVSAIDQGSYSVIVSNAQGSVLSSSASLKVLSSAPIISLQPTNQTLAPGATAVLHAEVSGNVPLVYQWRGNGTNLSDIGNRFGSTTDTLVLTNVTEADNGAYVLSISNNLGQTNTVAVSLVVVPVSAPGTRLSTLYSFGGGSDGGNPSELTDGSDGFLYGTTEFGGDLFQGSAFKIGTNGGLASLASFDQAAGAFPMTGLVLSSNGAFYGTASAGGPAGAGTVYAMLSTGQRSNVYTFSGATDGGTPSTLLTLSLDGNLYGSTRRGGTFGLGTIFQLTPQGALKVLHSFSGGTDGSRVGGALVELPNGILYGTTPDGGAFRQGSLFQFSQSSGLSVLYSFTGGMDGYDPVGALLPGDDGALYGATMSNSIRGLAFYGTLFKAGTNGTLNTTYALNFTDGSYPAAGLVVGQDGNFYGTTRQGGAAGFGTIFRMSPAGAFSTLVELDGFNDGALPIRALTAGLDGNLYGTTSAGGPGGAGTIFRLSFTGPPQITDQPRAQIGFTGGSASFGVAVTGAMPMAYQWQKNGTNLSDTPLLHGSAGRVLMLQNLQLSDTGTYSVVVSNAAGSIASASALLTVNVSPPVFETVRQNGGNLVFAWSAAAGRSYQLQSRTGLDSTNWINVGAPVTATGPGVQTSVPIGPGPVRFYRVLLLQ